MVLRIAALSSRPVGGKTTTVTYAQWSDLLQKSFERCYYVPSSPSDDSSYDINPAMVNRRGIYKDVYGTPKDREWSDYQLRCNFPLAMIVAPELFDPEHAMNALRIVDATIRGPLGMKTLDPADSAYRGNYDNSNDSDDMSVAKGWNYHQGPEWVFPTGWFLMAWLKFDRIAGEGKKVISIWELGSGPALTGRTRRSRCTTSRTCSSSTRGTSSRTHGEVCRS